MDAIHGASPSGALLLVDVRGFWPERDVARLGADPDPTRTLLVREETDRGAPLDRLAVLRAPEIGVDSLGIRAFGGEFSLCLLGVDELVGRGGDVLSPSLGCSNV